MGIKYETDNDLNIHGTRLFTTVTATYDQLVNLFGEPLHVNNDRVNVEWRVSFNDGEMLTIYDWNTDDYISNTKWNVGGNNFTGTSRIYDILAGKEIVA